MDLYYFKLNFASLRLEYEAQQAELLLQQDQQRKANGGSPTDDEQIDIPEDKPKVTNESLVPGEIRIKRYIIQNLHRVGFITLTCGIGLILPNFKLVIALFGALSNALLAYILPALFWIRICTPQLFTGVTWYPYDRNGKPTRSYEGSIQQQVDINYLSTTDSVNSKVQSPSNQDKAATEGDRLVLNTEDSSSDFNTTAKRQPKKDLVSTCGKISYQLFPYTVAILGSLASIIAVVEAVQDIIKEFGH